MDNVGQTFTRQVYYCSNVSTAISKSSSGTIKKMQTANKQLKHRKIQICPVKVSKLVCISRLHCFHFPSSKLYISYSLHSSTRKNIQSHCFNSLVSRPSKTTASTPHKMKSQSVSISGSFLFLIR